MAEVNCKKRRRPYSDESIPSGKRTGEVHLDKTLDKEISKLDQFPECEEEEDEPKEKEKADLKEEVEAGIQGKVDDDIIYADAAPEKKQQLVEEKTLRCSKMDHKKKLENQREFVVDTLDPDSGISDVLLTKGVISERERSRVKSCLDPFARSENLVSIILNGDKQKEFIEALKSTEQLHLANFILEDGKYKVQYGNNWPLTNREISILVANRVTIIKHMETNHGLLDHLVSQNVINMRQKETIHSKPTRHNQVEELIDILRRSSLRDYWITIQCLRETHQNHVADILGKGGDKLPEHVEDEGDESMEETEESIYVQEDDEDDVAVTRKMEQLFGEDNDAHNMGKGGTFVFTGHSEMGKNSAILRNNRDYLVESIIPDNPFMNLLSASGCLEDDDMRYIKTLINCSDRNDEILNSIEVHMYKAFICCLRQTGQNRVADVLERGGAVFKVKVDIDNKFHPGIETEIVEGINMLQNESQVADKDVAKMVLLLKTRNIEILGAQKEEVDITVWLWCQSEAAFDRMINMKKVGKLNDLLLWLFNKLYSNETLLPEEIEVGIGNTNMEFVCHSEPECREKANLF